jgi:hypothetical protein
MVISGDRPESELSRRDIELQDDFEKLAGVLGPDADQLGYRTVIVEEWQECEYGLDQFLLNRDRQNAYRVVVRNYRLNHTDGNLPVSHHEIAPGGKLELGCSQREPGGPVTWRVVVSEERL